MTDRHDTSFEVNDTTLFRRESPRRGLESYVCNPLSSQGFQVTGDGENTSKGTAESRTNVYTYICGPTG